MVRVGNEVKDIRREAGATEGNGSGVGVGTPSLLGQLWRQEG